jgi:hypothetical protein
MGRRFPLRTLVSASIIVAVGLSACRGSSSRSGRTAYVDRLPAPEEPLVMKVGEVGSYGGRFVTLGNTTPSTFNPVTIRPSTTPSSACAN